MILDQLGCDLWVFGISIAQKCDKKQKKKKNYIVEYDDNILYLLFDTIFGYNRKLYIYIIYFYSGERKM